MPPNNSCDINDTDNMNNTKNILLTLSLILIFAIQNPLLAEQTPSTKIADTFVMKGTIASEAVTIILTIPSNINNDSDDNNSSIKGIYFYNNQKKYIEIVGSMEQSNITLYGQEGEFTGSFDPIKQVFVGNLLNTIKNKIEVFNFSNNGLNISHLEIFERDYAAENFSISYFKIVEQAKDSYSIKPINQMIEQEINKKDSSAVKIKLIADEYDDHSSYYYHGRFFCEYVDENIIVITEYQSEFAGGEGQAEKELYYIYSIKTGKLLNESVGQLFNNKNNKTLLSMFKSKIESSYNYNQSDLNSFKISDHFYINTDGVHFAYNTHELSGLNKEICYVSFSFEELRPFIYKLSPFYYFFQ